MRSCNRFLANLREIMGGDIASILLRDIASGKMKLFALDFPWARGS